MRQVYQATDRGDRDYLSDLFAELLVDATPAEAEDRLRAMVAGGIVEAQDDDQD